MILEDAVEEGNEGGATSASSREGDGPASTSSYRQEVIEVKICRTKCPSPPSPSLPSSTSAALGKAEEVQWSPDGSSMLLPCNGGKEVLEVLLMQPPTKKVMSAGDFRNGLRRKRLLLPKA